MEKTINLTTEEAQALVQLLDVAVKSGGIGVSKAAMHFVDKLEAAFKEKKEESAEKVEVEEVN